jgi:hypothetical protein
VLVRPLVIAVGLTALAAVVDYTAAVWRARARPGPGGPHIPTPTGGGAV